MGTIEQATHNLQAAEELMRRTVEASERFEASARRVELLCVQLLKMAHKHSYPLHPPLLRHK